MPLLASPTYQLTPSQTPVVLQSNYIDDFDFLRTELPDTYSEEFERYGNRTIASFLRMCSAEYASTSDLIKWTEEGRLHTKYTDVQKVGNTFTKVGHVFRERQTILISDGTNIDKAIISAVPTADTFTALCYRAAGFQVPDATDLTIFVYGSEFNKGTNGMQGALEAETEIFDNKPIIIKDKYQVNGSDMAQIGWVEVSTEGGGSGYLWFIKSKHETRLRYDDYLEMSMVEGEPAEVGSDAAAVADGTKGFFYEVANRGNIFQSVATALTDFDDILKRLDKQGAIEENMLFVDRDQSLAIDDFLAAQNSYGAGGTSWGAFDNDEQMGLSLGFTDFRRGEYDFYKTSWKYLNDASTRGDFDGTGRIRGVLVPFGTKTVYDQVLGKKITKPFLHVKYRKSEAEDRKFKTWITGSAGGATNSDLDAMEVHYLSERALVTIGANNFVLIQD